MNKIVSASEFKATCLRLIEEMQKDGQPVTITRRGKVVAQLMPSRAQDAAPRKPLLGALKGTVAWTPGVDPAAPINPDWEAEWDAKWNRLLGPDEDRSA